MESTFIPCQKTGYDGDLRGVPRFRLWPYRTVAGCSRQRRCMSEVIETASVQEASAFVGLGILTKYVASKSGVVRIRPAIACSHN